MSQGRPMRRAERELADPSELDRILQSAQVLFLAFPDQPAPYVVPVCFGYENGVIYVHSAKAGAKLDLISREPMVGFSATTEMHVIAGDTPCSFSAQAESVVGTGRAEILTGETGRRRGLDLIMRHYDVRGGSAKDPDGPRPAYETAPLTRTCVIAIRVHTMRGKRIG
jgi:uncharacterized protein